MLESIELKGYFFIPENQNDELPGVLKFNKEDGIELELFGQFDSHKAYGSTENNIILGFTSNGKKVTLLNCFANSRRMSMPGFSTSTFSALYLFIGKHYQTTEEICFDRCSIEYTDFNYWLNISGFDKVKYDEDARVVNIKYKQPEKIIFQLDEKWSAEIEFVFSRPWEHSSPVEKASIQQYPCFTITPKERSTFKSFKQMFMNFGSFIALNYFTYPIAETIVFYIQRNEQDEDDSVYEKIELYFSQGKSTRKYKKHTERHDFLLQYKTYVDTFSEVIQNWYKLCIQIEATINILTECFINRGNPTEFHFIGLVQAIENMHRKLIFEKEKHLNKRLSEVIKSLPIKVKTGLLQNETDFIKRVTENRNYYTHYSVRDVLFTPASLSELFIISEKLKIILLSSILKELGFPTEKVETIIISKGAFLFNHVLIIKNFNEINTEELPDQLTS